jgi:TolA-binding protein
MRLGRGAWCAPLAAVLTAGCFATRNDVRLLKADIERMHATSEEARRADAQRLQAEIARRDSIATEANRRAFAALSDTLTALSDAFSMFRATQASTNANMQQQIATIQELLGVSQRQIAAMRARIEADREAAERGGAGDTTSGGEPGPVQLYQLGLGQSQRGAHRQARTAFEDFLKRFPNDSLIPMVMLKYADALEADRMAGQADSIRILIVDRHPKSEAAPNALFKRANASADAGRTAEARRLYDQLIKDYPGTEEARLAADRRARLPRGG